ncbi:SPW repeat protein [Nocardia jejuensis]|uniref:SPW repeat protein n=1 Tax=Nocardia jejuensis TaxID=328049 RepID=UPI000AA95CBB|nr:SPW repeat protein [Nocardia jejuensis]
MDNYANPAPTQQRAITDDHRTDTHTDTPRRIVDGLVLLTGLFTAISPWVVDDFGSTPRLVTQNLILGIAIAVVGLVLAFARHRRHASSWVLIPIGVWLLLAPWLIADRPDEVLWTNIVLGALTAALGAAALAMVASTSGDGHRPNTVPQIR